MKDEGSLPLSKHISSNVFKKGCGCVLWRLHLVSFSMWQYVKPCDERVYKYRFRVQVVGPAHSWFGIFVAVLSA